MAVLKIKTYKFGEFGATPRRQIWVLHGNKNGSFI